jgi:hypothetical protein
MVHISILGYNFENWDDFSDKVQGKPFLFPLHDSQVLNLNSVGSRILAKSKAHDRHHC